MDKVQIVAVDGGLIQSDGTISHHDMFDYLNLTNVGSKKVFEPVWDLLHQILTENEKERDLTPSEWVGLSEMWEGVFVRVRVPWRDCGLEKKEENTTHVCELYTEKKTHTQSRNW